MRISWDDAKRERERTLRQRGLDFADVEALDWSKALSRPDRRLDYGERRWITVGPIRGRLCVVVWVARDDTLRVISLRKANARERRYHAEALE